MNKNKQTTNHNTIKRVLIIANPTSGRKRRTHWREHVTEMLINAGMDVDTRLTTQNGDAQQWTTQACNDLNNAPDCVIACGGDGTIQEIASALALQRQKQIESEDPNSHVNQIPAMGVIASGRCNDLARVLDLYESYTTAAESIISGIRTPIDLGCVNGRFFCTVATMGFDAAVSRFVDQMKMPLVGTPAYLYGALRVIMTYKARRLKISGDFGVIDAPVILATSANTATYGGAVPIAPDATPTDGMLDLCIINDAPRHRLIPLLIKTLSGKHVGQPGVQILKTKGFTIECDNDTMEIWADGEWITNTPAKIEIVPNAIDIMLPSSSYVVKHT